MMANVKREDVTTFFVSLDVLRHHAQANFNCRQQTYFFRLHVAPHIPFRNLRYGKLSIMNSDY